MARWAKVAAAAALAVASAVVAVWTVHRLNGDTGRLTVTGTVEAMQVDISPKITGRIVELAVREGQRVEQGRLLVVLDAAELSAETERAGAAVRAAEAQLRNLHSGARSEEIREAQARVAQAQARLDDLLAGSRTEEIEQARAALRHASVTREWTQRELARARELFARDLIAAQEIDRAKQAYDSAAASEAAARERLALLEAGPRRHEVEAARAELQAARERLDLLRAGARPQEVEAAQARVAEARSTLALARARQTETRLTAPITGVVLRKNAEVGETVNPGVSILTLVDPRDLWVRGYVPETDIGRVRIGQAAAVTVDAFPGRAFVGTVSEIAAEAEFTPKNVQTKKERVNLVFRVKITVGDSSGVLKPGMPADAELAP